MVPDNAGYLEQRVRERIAISGSEAVEAGPAGGAPWVCGRSRVPAVDTSQLVFSLADLLAFHDREFLQYAYLVIFGRDPDAYGLHSRLELLQSGAMSRVNILMRMRYSAEGKSRGATVKGLNRAFAMDRLCALPVIGYLARGVRALVYLPRLQRDLEEMRGAMVMERLHMEDQLARLAEQQSTPRRNEPPAKRSFAGEPPR